MKRPKRLTKAQKVALSRAREAAGQQLADIAEATPELGGERGASAVTAAPELPRGRSAAA